MLPPDLQGDNYLGPRALVPKTAPFYAYANLLKFFLSCHVYGNLHLVFAILPQILHGVP